MALFALCAILVRTTSVSMMSLKSVRGNIDEEANDAGADEPNSLWSASAWPTGRFTSKRPRRSSLRFSLSLISYLQGSDADESCVLARGPFLQTSVTNIQRRSNPERHPAWTSGAGLIVVEGMIRRRVGKGFLRRSDPQRYKH